MIKNSENKMRKMQESINKDLEELKNKHTNPIISRQDYHLTQPYESEEKQTNKNSAQISPYMKLTQTTGPTLGGQKPKEEII